MSARVDRRNEMESVDYRHRRKARQTGSSCDNTLPTHGQRTHLLGADDTGKDATRVDADAHADGRALHRLRARDLRGTCNRETYPPRSLPALAHPVSIIGHATPSRDEASTHRCKHAPRSYGPHRAWRRPFAPSALRCRWDPRCLQTHILKIQCTAVTRFCSRTTKTRLPSRRANGSPATHTYASPILHKAQTDGK